MDWGLIQKHRGAPWWRRYRIRDERIYPYLWVYYAAAVLNLLGRLAWALTITPHSVLEVFFFLGIVNIYLFFVGIICLFLVGINHHTALRAPRYTLVER
jgi:hypothetical protein